MTLRKRPKNRRKQCFVIQQMGGRGSKERRHADAVLAEIIRPAASENGYVARRIDELGTGGMISEGIVEALYSAELVVADLAGLNPNVMYELGVRQAWNLPLVQIAPQVNNLPFDIRDINTLPYGDPTRSGDCRSARSQLKRRIAAVTRKAGVSRVFADMFRKACDPFKMLAVRRAAHLAVRDLLASLRDRIREVERETDRASDEAFRTLALLVREPFSSLRDKNHVLVEIAEDAKDERLAGKLRDLGVLATMGDRAIQMLEKRPRTGETLRKVRDQLQKAKSQAQEFAQDLDGN